MKQSELNQHKRAIDDALTFAKGLHQGSPEQAMLARYICVLASGFLENIVRTHLSEFARQSRPKSDIMSYVEASVDRFQNPGFENILQITGQFSATWRKRVEALDEKMKSAITSIVANRHLIAHGRQSSISLAQVSEYVERAKEFMEEYSRICR